MINHNCSLKRFLCNVFLILVTLSFAYTANAADLVYVQEDVPFTWILSSDGTYYAGTKVDNPGPTGYEESDSDSLAGNYVVSFKHTPPGDLTRQADLPQAITLVVNAVWESHLADNTFDAGTNVKSTATFNADGGFPPFDPPTVEIGGFPLSMSADKRYEKSASYVVGNGSIIPYSGNVNVDTKYGIHVPITDSFVCGISTLETFGQLYGNIQVSIPYCGYRVVDNFKDYWTPPPPWDPHVTDGGYCYDDPQNWPNGHPPNGLLAKPNFGQWDIGGNHTVNIGDGVSPLTVSEMEFNDLDTNTPGAWIVNDTSSAQTGINFEVTIGSEPTITCGTATTFNAGLHGYLGLVKQSATSGDGQLNLFGDNSGLYGGITFTGNLGFLAQNNLGPTVDPNPLVFKNGILVYLGTSDLTLTNPINPSNDFNGGFIVSGSTTVNPVTLTINQSFGSNNNGDGLKTNGGPGSAIMFNGNINAPGNVSFDADWSDNSNPNCTVTITGALTSGGYVGGLYIGSKLVVSGNGSITHYDGDRTECYNQGSITLTDNAQFSTQGYKADNPYTGSLLIGSWSSGPSGAVLIARDNSYISIGHDLIIGASGDPGTVAISGNASLYVQNKILIGDEGGTANSMIIGDNATVNAGEIRVANDSGLTGGQVGTLNITGNARVTIEAGRPDNLLNPTPTITTGNLLINPNNTGATAVVEIEDNGSLTVGGTTINNGVMNLDSTGTFSFNDISGSGILNVGGIHNTQVTVSYICLNTLTINAGSTLVIAAIPAGPLADLNMTAVPEPSTLALLCIAVMCLALAPWRRN